MKFLILLLLFSNFCLSQSKILFSIDSITVYQSLKKLNLDETISDSETFFYSDISSYSLYELDLVSNSLNVYHDRNLLKYTILNKSIISDVIVLDVYEGLDLNGKDVITNYKIDLNSNSTLSMVYHYYDENQSMTFGTTTKKIKVLNCE